MIRLVLVAALTNAARSASARRTRCRTGHCGRAAARRSYEPQATAGALSLHCTDCSITLYYTVLTVFCASASLCSPRGAFQAQRPAPDTSSSTYWSVCSAAVHGEALRCSLDAERSQRLSSLSHVISICARLQTRARARRPVGTRVHYATRRCSIGHLLPCSLYASVCVHACGTRGRALTSYSVLLFCCLFYLRRPARLCALLIKALSISLCLDMGHLDRSTTRRVHHIVSDFRH